MLPLQMPEGKWQRHINAACKARNENHLPSLSSSKAACEFFMVSWIDVRKPTSSSIIKNISCICICIYLFLNFSISLFLYSSSYLFIYLSIKQQWLQLATNISESPWLRKKKVEWPSSLRPAQNAFMSCRNDNQHNTPWSQYPVVQGFKSQPAICAIPLLRIFQVGNLSLHTFLEATNSNDFYWIFHENWSQSAGSLRLSRSRDSAAERSTVWNVWMLSNRLVRTSSEDATTHFSTTLLLRQRSG